MLSSRIEGTQASVSDLVLFEAEQPARDDGADVREVFNYMAAVEHTPDPDRRLPLSVPLLREAHAILLSGVRGDYATPGDVRRSRSGRHPADDRRRTEHARPVAPPGRSAPAGPPTPAGVVILTYHRRGLVISNGPVGIARPPSQGRRGFARARSPGCGRKPGKVEEPPRTRRVRKVTRNAAGVSPAPGEVRRRRRGGRSPRRRAGRGRPRRPWPGRAAPP